MPSEAADLLLEFCSKGRYARGSNQQQLQGGKTLPALSHIMRLPSRKFLAILLIVAIAALGAICIWLGPGKPPEVSVSYLQTIDGHGHWRLQFGITNVGGAKVFTYPGAGHIELIGHTNPVSVGLSSPLKELAPGQGQVIEAVLSEKAMASIDEKWRLTCFYADNGLRTRLYRWQFGPHGPGAKAWWLIPKKLRGMALKVRATSEWIPPPKPSESTKRTSKPLASMGRRSTSSAREQSCYA
jgi:hypothetical protein